MTEQFGDRKITDAKSGAAFPVRVTTRAAETEIVGVDNEDILRVRLQASPAGDPAANKELVEFLASFLGVELEQVEIVAGHDERDKLVTIEGVTVADIESKLRPS